jgi:hypothetical protein
MPESRPATALKPGDVIDAWGETRVVVFIRAATGDPRVEIGHRGVLENPDTHPRSMTTGRDESIRVVGRHPETGDAA